MDRDASHSIVVAYFCFDKRGFVWPSVGSLGSIGFVRNIAFRETGFEG